MRDSPDTWMVGLAFLLPYIMATMVNHFRIRNWEKAFGWLLLFLFCLTGFFGTFFTSVLYSGLGNPHQVFLNLILWPLIVQAMFWGFVYINHDRVKIYHGYKAVALISLFLCLVIGILTPFSYNGLRDIRIAQDQQILDNACYIEYPGAEFPDEHYDYKGGPGFECISITFLTDDDPEDVFDFYQQHADDSGLVVSTGITTYSENRGLWALGEEPVAFEVELDEEDNEWVFTAYWSDYMEAIENNFEWRYELLDE